jgi:hypothetical protein
MSTANWRVKVEHRSAVGPAAEEEANVDVCLPENLFCGALKAFRNLRRELLKADKLECGRIKRFRHLLPPLVLPSVNFSNFIVNSFSLCLLRIASSTFRAVN